MGEQQTSEVVVDMISADLIGAMKKGGYESPFVICGTPLGESKVPYVPLLLNLRGGLQEKLAELIVQPQGSPDSE